jgi:hypothetical protein
MKQTYLLLMAVILSAVAHAQWNGPLGGTISTTNRVHLNYTAVLPPFNPTNPAPLQYCFSINFNNGTTIEPSIRVNEGNGQVEIGKTFRLINGSSFFMNRTNGASFFRVDNQGLMRLTTDGISNASRGFYINNGSIDFYSVNQQGILFQDQTKELFKVNSNGFAFARKMTITLSNPFPDYVFEQQYKLMPLTELELFIKQFKHLPNMPSAQQVTDNNNEVELGEMQLKLLEKIEELTLYVIQQQQEIDALKCQLEQLK